MFFTSDLLSRRDSGFGLLWLAATLGDKSSLRKLSRRSVVTANIVQLCNLIVDPPEPLALRLSSNLMMGVVRVYRVKQDILFTDVSTCFNTLKKTVQDMHISATAPDSQIIHPSVRPDALTVTTDLGHAFSVQFDHLFDMHDALDRSTEGNPPFGTGSQPRSKGATMHTLNEDHQYLLSASFDTSYIDDSLGPIGASSSQAGIAFDDTFFDSPGGGNDIGDELARELGSGWGGSPGEHLVSMMGITDSLDAAAPRRGSTPHAALAVDDATYPDILPDVPGTIPLDEIQGQYVPSVQELSGLSPNPGALHPPSPVPNGSTSRPEGVLFRSSTHDAPIKPKRSRFYLDMRTELTSEELQIARSNYAEAQTLNKCELDGKKVERVGEYLLQDMISGIPHYLYAPLLVKFWSESFKRQLQLRPEYSPPDVDGPPPRKRRRIANDLICDALAGEPSTFKETTPDEIAVVEDVQVFEVFEDILGRDYHGEPASKLRSSEEPGQARHVSRPSSMIGSYMGRQFASAELPGSQRSALFPWDHAGGVSSSVVDGLVAGTPVLSDRPSFGEARGWKGGSLSRRGSARRTASYSPISANIRNFDMGDDAFEFDVSENAHHLEVANGQTADLSIVVLEQHSRNFLEYCKIQLNAFPSATGSFTFDDIVPVGTSTRRVATAAFYHCLVLATKKLIRVNQAPPTNTLYIAVK